MESIRMLACRHGMLCVKRMQPARLEATEMFCFLSPPCHSRLQMARPPLPGPVFCVLPTCTKQIPGRGTHSVQIVLSTRAQPTYWAAQRGKGALAMRGGVATQMVAVCFASTSTSAQIAQTKTIATSTPNAPILQEALRAAAQEDTRDLVWLACPSVVMACALAVRCVTMATPVQAMAARLRVLWRPTLCASTAPPPPVTYARAPPTITPGLPTANVLCFVRQHQAVMAMESATPP